MIFDLHFNLTERLTLHGQYMTFQIGNNYSRNELGLQDKEIFDTMLNVFVTNDYYDVLGSLNGFLGIGPCPRELEHYSFAS